MIILQIACVIGIASICILGAFVSLFILWVVLWLIENLILILLGKCLRQYAHKKGTYASNNTHPKFKFGSHSVYLIDCLESVYDRLKPDKSFSNVLIDFPTCWWHINSDDMKQKQPTHRNKEDFKSLTNIGVSSFHTPNSTTGETNAATKNEPNRSLRWQDIDGGTK